MSSPVTDKILRALLATGSIPNGLIFYGEECEFLLHFSIGFIREVNCSCAQSAGLCNNCALFSSFRHPDIKFIFPIIHLNDDDCCDNYNEEFKTFFIKKGGEYNLEMWAEHLSKQGKQVSILNNDIERIKSFASLPSIVGKYKIIVMCFPETLNKSSSNMLLKMMEDPSFDKTLFLFLTNDFFGLLPTIRSRCLSVFVPNDNDSNYKNSTKENLKKNDVICENVIMWLKHCYNLDYVQINIINEKIASQGKEGVKRFLLTALNVLNDFLYVKFNVVTSKYIDDSADGIERIYDALLFGDIVNIFNRINREVLNISRNVNLKVMIFDLSIFIAECLNRTSH